MSSNMSSSLSFTKGDTISFKDDDTKKYQIIDFITIEDEFNIVLQEKSSPFSIIVMNFETFVKRMVDKKETKNPYTKTDFIEILQKFMEANGMLEKPEDISYFNLGPRTRAIYEKKFGIQDVNKPHMKDPVYLDGSPITNDEKVQGELNKLRGEETFKIPSPYRCEKCGEIHYTYILPGGVQAGISFTEIDEERWFKSKCYMEYTCHTCGNIWKKEI